MWNAQRIEVADDLGTIPWLVGAAVMVALSVAMNALAVRLGHRAGHQGFRLLALAWSIPPATLLLPVLLPLLDRRLPSPRPGVGSQRGQLRPSSAVPGARPTAGRPRTRPATAAHRRAGELLEDANSERISIEETHRGFEEESVLSVRVEVDFADTEVRMRRIDELLIGVPALISGLLIATRSTCREDHRPAARKAENRRSLATRNTARSSGIHIEDVQASRRCAVRERALSAPRW